MSETGVALPHIYATVTKSASASRNVRIRSSPVRPHVRQVVFFAIEITSHVFTGTSPVP
jgi:hypothetical protein